MYHQRIRDFCRTFCDDERGSISIEFIIAIPLLLFLVTGGLTYWDAFYSNSRTAKVAYAVNDIMTRHDVVDATDLDFVTAMVEKILPERIEDRALRITSVCFEGGAHKVLWSHAVGERFAAMEDEDIPLSILPEMAPQDSVIVTELRGSWAPKFWNVGIGRMSFDSELVGRPRFVKIIPHTGLNPSNLCPGAPAPTA